MPAYPLPGFFEPVNAILHLGAALVFSFLGVKLILRGRGDRLRVGLVTAFVVAAVVMLSMSGVYHMLADGTGGAAVMIRLDKASIFVLIAGTFTPVHGLLFRGPVRWAGLGLMWAAAATGVTLTTIFHDHMPYGLGTTLFIALGWIAGVSVIAAWRRGGFAHIRPAVIGGVLYSAGAILLGLKWPTIIPGVFEHHELWHVAVIAGLSMHWRFVARMVRDDQRSAEVFRATAEQRRQAAVEPSAADCAS